MTATRVLTWVSRALFAAGLVLFASLFVFMAVGSSPTGVDANGQKFHSVSAGEMGVLVLVFSSIAWCWLAGAAARTLATAASWPRALTEIASLVGFGVIFAAPIYAVSGRDGMAAALACFVSGFAVIIVAKVVAFVAFGAKEAAASIDGEVARVKGMYHQAQQRNVERMAPPPFAPQGFTPSQQTFTPSERTFTPSQQTFTPSERTFTPEPPAQEPPPLAR